MNKIYLIRKGRMFSEGYLLDFYFLTKQKAEIYLREVEKMKKTKQEDGSYLFEEYMQPIKNWAWIEDYYLYGTPL